MRLADPDIDPGWSGTGGLMGRLNQRLLEVPQLLAYRDMVNVRVDKPANPRVQPADIGLPGGTHGGDIRPVIDLPTVDQDIDQERFDS